MQLQDPTPDLVEAGDRNAPLQWGFPSTLFAKIPYGLKELSPFLPKGMQTQGSALAPAGKLLLAQPCHPPWEGRLGKPPFQLWLWATGCQTRHKWGVLAEMLLLEV